MGASDSKLVFKKGIFKLSEERNIAADDPYWTSVSSPRTHQGYPQLIVGSSGSFPKALKMSSIYFLQPTSVGLETMLKKTLRR
jgi:hypothetical protein